MSIDYKLTRISFQEIYPTWRDLLWPNRASEIRPYSIIEYLGGKNPEIAKFAEPHFYRLTLDNKVVGVNSGHLTSKFEYRNRGLWIDPKFRGKSLSHLFFDKSVQDARSLGCKILWSLPRETAIKSYSSYGFQIVSDWDFHSYEFGPNCFVKIDLQQKT
jgi:GNAT superfamily N-acetyltransferase